MSRDIFDPRMLDRLGDFFPSLASIQEDTGGLDANGAPVESWGDLAGHTGLSCAVAPTGGQEVKKADQTYVVANYSVLFPTDQTAVTEKMRVIVTGANAGTYDMLLIQSDSFSGETRVYVNEVE